jgi:hypothetical protein
MTDKPIPPICLNCKHVITEGVIFDERCGHREMLDFSPVTGLMAPLASLARGEFLAYGTSSGDLVGCAKCGPDGGLFEQRDDSARELRFVWRWLWKFICLFRRKA